MTLSQLTATEAFELLNDNKNSILIDVRTVEEWSTIGVPDVSHEQLILLSWRMQPDMSINPEFSDIITQKIKDKDTRLIFMCRGGVRSNEASQLIHSMGFNNCFNVIDGFEGGNNGLGWKNSSLPYKLL